MSLLLAQQIQFAGRVAMLIQKAFDLGYSVTFGEAYRSKEQAEWDCQHHTGVADSLHTQRLAIDLNFFKDGVYIADGSKLADIGAFWKSLGPENRWGGDIVHPRPDGNHFSLSPDGVKA